MKYSVGYSYSFHYPKNKGYLILCCQSVAANKLRSGVQCLLNGGFHEAVQAHIVGHCRNHCLFVQFRGNTHIEAALICLFRFRTGLCTHFQIIIHSTVEISHKLGSIVSFIGDQRTNSQNLTVEQSVFLRKFYTANIPLIFHRIVHRSPSCSRISTAILDYYLLSILLSKIFSYTRSQLFRSL